MIFCHRRRFLKECYNLNIPVCSSIPRFTAWKHSKEIEGRTICRVPVSWNHLDVPAHPSFQLFCHILLKNRETLFVSSRIATSFGKTALSSTPSCCVLYLPRHLERALFFTSLCCRLLTWEKKWFMCDFLLRHHSNIRTCRRFPSFLLYFHTFQKRK